jgi:hypothetical protein
VNRPVSPRDNSTYEPIPWRKPDWKPDQPPTRRPTNQYQRRDTVTTLIDNYRTTKYNPTLGKEDHFGFQDEPEIEEWPSAAMVDEILATYTKNQDARAAAAAAEERGEPRHETSPPPGQHRPRPLTSDERAHAAAPTPLFSPTLPPQSSSSGRERPQERLREFAPADPPPRPPSSMYGGGATSVYGVSRPPTQGGARPPPRGGLAMSSARLSAEQMADEYRRDIGRTNPFSSAREERVERAMSVASNMTEWPSFSDGEVKGFK